MKKQKSEKVKLIGTILKGKKTESLKALRLLKQYKSLDIIVFFCRDDGFFESNTCEGVFTRDEINRDFQNPILFLSTKAMREMGKNLKYLKFYTFIKTTHMKTLFFFLTITFSVLTLKSQTLPPAEKYVLLEGQNMLEQDYLYQDSNYVYFQKDNSYFKISQDKVL